MCHFEVNRATTFAIINTKHYFPIVTLLTQCNAKLLRQLKSGFKRTSNWNKYHSKVWTQVQNRYLHYLINSSFQGVNRLFLLSFEPEADRVWHTWYYLTTVEIKDYNVAIDGQNLFNQPIRSNIKTYENIRKIVIGQGHDYTTGCLLDNPYFKESYKLIAIDLSKQQVHDADSKVMQ